MTTTEPGRIAAQLALFDALVDLDAAARRARLDAVAAEDPALAAAVAAMLEADDDADGPLDAPFEQAAATMVAGVAVAPLPQQIPGRVVGSFVLERLLGRGGMGEVWLAVRERGGVRQQVALKVLHAGLRSGDLRARFAQEGRILAGLSHPAIARFIEAGVDDDGTPWYAMAHVEGLPINRYVREHRFDLRARIALLAEVAQAVAHAQAQMVVHRDIKPSNILVDAAGHPHLLDFGIAKLLDEGAAPAAETATGLRAMSPAYAAPEQILGEPIGTATDVYALGLVTYELITGVLPHAREALPLERLADAVQSENPERPSACLRAGRGGPGAVDRREARRVAGDLDTVVMVALRRERERRHASAGAYADDLRRWLEGRTVAARPDSAGYRLRRFVARNWPAVASVSGVVLALVVGIAVALWQAGIAREEAARARAEAVRAEAIRGFTLSMLREQDLIARGASAARTPAELVAEGIARARTQFAAGDPLRLELLDELGALQADFGDPQAAEAVLAEVVAARAGSDPATRAARARSQSALAVARAQLGDAEGALALAREAATVLLRELGPDHAATIQADGRLLSMAVATGEEAELTALATGLVRRAGARHGDTATEVLTALFALAQVQERFDRLEAASATLGDLVARIERTRGADHALLVRPLGLRGDILRRLRRYDEALPLYDRAVAIAQAQGARASHGAVLMRRGDLHRRIGNDSAAQSDLESAASLLAEGSAQRAQVEQFLGSLAKARGDLETALDHYQRAWAGFERAIGGPSVFSWTCALGVVEVETLRGRAAAVEDLAREALAAMRRLSPPPSVDVFFALTVVARLDVALDRRESARAALAEAIEVGTAVYSADHPGVLEARLLHAELSPPTDGSRLVALEALLAVPGLPKAMADRARAALAGGVATRDP